ncbi:MAG: hypothetical protein Q8L24_02780 [bacterium]|nr:hypothetical protein [bacterium]
MPKTREQVLEDLRKNPKAHRHTREGLDECCRINGKIDLVLVGAHREFVDLGSYNGIRCDVTGGGCACGKFH